MQTPPRNSFICIVYLDLRPEIFVAYQCIIRIDVEIDDGISNKTQEEHDQNHDHDREASRGGGAAQISLQCQSLEIELMAAFMAFPQRAWPDGIGPGSLQT